MGNRSLQDMHVRSPVRIDGSINDAAQTAAIRPATNPASTIRIMNCMSKQVQPDDRRISGLNTVFACGEDYEFVLQKTQQKWTILRAAENDTFVSTGS